MAVAEDSALMVRKLLLPALAAAALAASLSITPAVSHADGACSSYIRLSNPWLACVQEVLDHEEHLTCDMGQVEAVLPIEDKLYCADPPNSCREKPFQEGGCPS